MTAISVKRYGSVDPDLLYLDSSFGESGMYVCMYAHV